MMSLAALMLAACKTEPVANNGEATVPDVAAPPANAVGETNAAAAAVPPAAQPAARYRFIGTEPFWGGTILGSTSSTGRPTTRSARQSPRQ